MKNTVKILALADIHGDMNRIPRIAESLKEADIVLLVGDITNFGGTDKARQVMDILTRYNPKVFGVHGNCDLPGVEEVLRQMDGCLNHSCLTVQDVQFIGVGGSLPCPGVTPSEIGESVFQDILDGMVEMVDMNKPWIFVSHQPPYGTKIDAVSPSRHTGSQAIRRFIEQYQPVLAVSGHIHEACGMDKLNETILVNPGPFCKGCYAVIEVNGRAVKANFNRID